MKQYMIIALVCALTPSLNAMNLKKQAFQKRGIPLKGHLRSKTSTDQQIHQTKSEKHDPYELLYNTMYAYYLADVSNPTTQDNNEVTIRFTALVKAIKDTSPKL